MAAPVLVGALIGGLASAVSSLVGRVLIALGIGFVAYVGFGALLDQFTDVIDIAFTEIPTQVGQILGVMMVDVCVKMVLSAASIRMVLMGVTGSGSIRRLRQTGA